MIRRAPRSPRDALLRAVRAACAPSSPGIASLERLHVAALHGGNGLSREELWAALRVRQGHAAVHSNPSPPPPASRYAERLEDAAQARRIGPDHEHRLAHRADLAHEYGALIHRLDLADRRARRRVGVLRSVLIAIACFDASPGAIDRALRMRNGSALSLLHEALRAYLGDHGDVFQRIEDGY